MGLKNPKYTKALRRELRQKMTEAESMLWEHVRAKKLGLNVKRQYGIGPYILDFYVPRIRLAIEVDGGIHLKPEVKEKDLNKDTFLQENGIFVMRFKNEDVLHNIDYVIFEIKSRIEDESDQST